MTKLMVILVVVAALGAVRSRAAEGGEDFTFEDIEAAEALGSATAVVLPSGAEKAPGAAMENNEDLRPAPKKLAPNAKAKVPASNATAEVLAPLALPPTSDATEEGLAPPEDFAPEADEAAYIAPASGSGPTRLPRHAQARSAVRASPANSAPRAVPSPANSAARAASDAAVNAIPTMDEADAAASPDSDAPAAPTHSAEPQDGLAPQVRVPAVFTFKTTFESSGDRLALGDLATCAGEPSICEEAYGVDLGAAPEPGRTVHLTRVKLEDMLAREWDAAAIQVVAPEGVKITSSSSQVDEIAITDALRSRIAEELAGRSDVRIEVQKLRVPVRPRLRPTAFTIEFPGLDGLRTHGVDQLARRWNGAQRLDVRFLYETGATASASAQVDLLLERQLPVPRRDLVREAIIKENDLETAWVPLSRSSLKLATTEDELIGRRLKRDTSALEPIALSLLEIPLAVQKNQLVRLIMRTGALSVSGEVRTLAAGGYGQTIEAVYPATKKKLQVRIIDSTSVESLH